MFLKNDTTTNYIEQINYQKKLVQIKKKLLYLNLYFYMVCNTIKKIKLTIFLRCFKLEKKPKKNYI